ncbi:MAG: hypothetical protein EOP84_04440 [Verrucomicrobiaceae bacterium]|nr:MAG: hypothetical protein EOP84_04440 [Verrucomicrobiaceae bacterium]
MESRRGLYLGVFTSNKRSAKWRAWYAMTEAQQAAKANTGVAAVAQWEKDHAADIVYGGGPLGPTKRGSENGVEDVVNELTVFIVVRAASHAAAADLLKDHPHITIFTCDAVEVMPVLG